MKKILVTGKSHGLGAGLVRLLGGEGLQRDCVERYINKSICYDLIVHAGFERETPNVDHRDYVNRAEDLLKNLLKINCKKFVFISSIDCNNHSINSSYRDAKISCENLVNKVENSLNLRLPSIYGSEMKKNQIFSLATIKNPKLSLRFDSTFSLISYEDVANFILNTQHTGTINLVSDINLLKDIASYFGAKPTFGEYRYDTITTNSFETIVINRNKSLENYHDFIIKTVEIDNESV